MSAFITFEGPEGSGKTTQAEHLKEALLSRNFEVILTREPGGTDIGDAIRNILLDPRYEEMDSLTELFLYEASRRQHVENVIKPALNRNKIVLSDRCADASLVYQGIARGLDRQTVKELNDIATGSLKPDLTFILDVEAENGLKRARNGTDDFNENGDRIESESMDFHRRIRDGYRQLAEEEPDRCVLLSQNNSIKAIHETIMEHVEDLI